jgi:hypothetical protein
VASDLGTAIPLVRDLLQIAASVVVIVLGLAAWAAVRAAAAGPRVQMDVDMQVLDIGGGGELVGEMMIVLQNLGPRTQTLFNLFVEVRPSRHASSGSGTIVLAPGVRHSLTWTFEIPREERLLRTTVVFNCGKWLEPEAVASLSQRNFEAFGPTMQYVARVFEVTAASFRRF